MSIRRTSSGDSYGCLHFSACGDRDCQHLVAMEASFSFFHCIFSGYLEALDGQLWILWSGREPRGFCRILVLIQWVWIYKLNF